MRRFWEFKRDVAQGNNIKNKFKILKDSELNDDKKLPMKYSNKRVNENLMFLITPIEFLRLMESAKIKSSDLHIKGYHLSRFEDKGNYTFENCRFIHYSLNYKEKKISRASREASKRNIILANKRRTNIVSSAMKKYWASLKEEAKKSRENFEKTAHKSYLGSKNSQFGTCWITKENINKKIKKEDLDTFISLGWVRGRK